MSTFSLSGWETMTELILVMNKKVKKKNFKKRCENKRFKDGMRKKSDEKGTF